MATCRKIGQENAPTQTLSSYPPGPRSRRRGEGSVHTNTPSRFGPGADGQEGHGASRCPQSPTASLPAAAIPPGFRAAATPPRVLPHKSGSVGGRSPPAGTPLAASPPGLALSPRALPARLAQPHLMSLGLNLSRREKGWQGLMGPARHHPLPALHFQNATPSVTTQQKTREFLSGETN